MAQHETISQGLYVTCGTLRRESPCYVDRSRRRPVYGALRQGKFCSVLTAGQIGKSSLMVRIAALCEEGVGVAMLDRTAIGQNLMAQQRYGGRSSRSVSSSTWKTNSKRFGIPIRSSVSCGAVTGKCVRSSSDALIDNYGDGQTLISQA
jgi:hypothetical protein